jgi:hypothetical protein
MASENSPEAADADLVAALGDYRTESGCSLLDLADASPVLLIFVRHFGCSFCRATLDQVSKIRAQILAKGVNPVFVHLGTPEVAKPYFDYFKLSDVERVSNPDASLYQRPVFGLGRINPIWHLVNPMVWWGWLRGDLFRYGIGAIKDDAHQMPGVFFVKDRKIAKAFRYKTIADEPPFLKMIR